MDISPRLIFLRDGHHHLLELGLQAEADEPDLAGPVGDATGSSVCNGSGTITALTTIWYAVLINQIKQFQFRWKKPFNI